MCEFQYKIGNTNLVSNSNQQFSPFFRVSEHQSRMAGASSSSSGGQADIAKKTWEMSNNILEVMPA